MQTLHRSRDRLVGERTALINQLRAILLERGMVAPQGKRKLEQFLSVLMDEQDGAGLSPRMIVLVADAREAMGGTRSTDLCVRRRVRPLGEGERRGSPVDHDPRDRGDCRLRPCRRCWSGGELRPWTGSRRMARSGPSTVHHRRQAEAARDQQARQQIPAPTADPWSACGAALCGSSATRRSADGRKISQVAPTATLRSSPSPTSWRGSPGRCCGAKSGLPRQDCRRRRRVRRSDTKRRTAKGVCERVTTGWPDSQTALRKPGSKNGAI